MKESTIEKAIALLADAILDIEHSKDIRDLDLIRLLYEERFDEFEARTNGEPPLIV
jgi:hypothetical protein